jgi:hypothetical protein
MATQQEHHRDGALMSPRSRATDELLRTRCAGPCSCMGAWVGRLTEIAGVHGDG